MGDVVGDGTFHICRHLKYAQIYILVSTIRQGDRIFTMPIWYSLMEKRREIDYNDMFSDLQYYYNLYYNETLHIPRIRIDMERATFNSIGKNFENSDVVFCRVHIIRGWTKWMKQYFGVRFYKDEEINCFFKALCVLTLICICFCAVDFFSGNHAR